MGKENFTAMQIMNSLSVSGMEIVPKIVTGGTGSSGGVDALIGLTMLDKLGAFPKKDEIILAEEKKNNSSDKNEEKKEENK
jgi:hypothetical protein